MTQGENVMGLNRISTTRISSFIGHDDPPSPKYTGVTGDKTIRFRLYWRYPGEPDSAERGETYEQRTMDPVQWSKDILAWFNSTLRPHETKRVFVRCEIEGDVPPAEHKWFKCTAMTKSFVGGDRHGSMYDAMQCERCGVTGKRFHGYVKLDSTWRKAAFKRCDTAMEELGRWPPAH